METRVPFVRRLRGRCQTDVLNNGVLNNGRAARLRRVEAPDFLLFGLMSDWPIVVNGGKLEENSFAVKLFGAHRALSEARAAFSTQHHLSQYFPGFFERIIGIQISNTPLYTALILNRSMELAFARGSRPSARRQ
jgi:hypothetical protein